MQMPCNAAAWQHASGCMLPCHDLSALSHHEEWCASLGTHPSAFCLRSQGRKSTKRGKYSYGAPSCQQMVEKQQETVIMLDPEEDEATITSLEGSCADYHAGWDTLGGGCDVLCDHTSDLLRINMFASKSMAFGSSGNGAPVQCR